MPLTINCGMCLWGSDKHLPPDQTISPYFVQQLNWLMWRASKQYLICHPLQEPNHAFATTGLAYVTKLPRA